MGCCKSRSSVAVAPSSDYVRDMHWLDLRYHQTDQKTVVKPHELESTMEHPPQPVDKNALNRVVGSMLGLALGDALGAHVEFRPRQYLLEHPVTDLQGGGTWGLTKGQFTDDTSMSLCLAISLIVSHGFLPYDQLVRYKWWYRHGYMSSTGECFDIGAATRQALSEFERRQEKLAQKSNIPPEHIDRITDRNILDYFDVKCGKSDAAGNGGLMRLAPVPLFYWRDPARAVECSGLSNAFTHGDRKAVDACRYYGALIVAALRGEPKSDLLHKDFYHKHLEWFAGMPLHPEVNAIVEGSYKRKNGYEDGIRGKGYVLDSLAAALWAFWSDEDSFEKGVLAAIQLGDDTDTTAAIYGQLAGAFYGRKGLPDRWVGSIYAREFITCLCEWIVYAGEQGFKKKQANAVELKEKSKL